MVDAIIKLIQFLEAGGALRTFFLILLWVFVVGIVAVIMGGLSNLRLITAIHHGRHCKKDD